MPEGHPVVSWMRVTELAKFQRATFPKWNQNAFMEVLERYQLRESSRAADLSRGERAGVALALTLATEPELILLDEPALGLDPFARRGLLETIVRITRDSQRTILLSSHVLADIERVADEVAILDGAVLRANCSLEHFRSKLVRYVLRYRPDKPIPQVPEPANVPGLLQVTRGAHEIVLSLVNDTPATKQFIDSLAPDECEELPLDLEQAFVDYLGRRPVRAPCDSNMLHGVANK